MKRALKVAVAAGLSIAMCAPALVFAADIDAPKATVSEGEHYENNNSDVDTNNGTIDTNTSTGTVDENNGAIDKNEGFVNVNNSEDDPNTYPEQEGGIDENTGRVNTNNGSIDMMNPGKGGAEAIVGVNNGTIGFVNVKTSVEENASTGSIDTVMGTVDVNEGYIGEISTNPTQGTAELKPGTVKDNKGQIWSNSGSVEKNEGTVNYNHEDGVVVNADGGVVKVNMGGTVNGTGTVEINLSHADKVSKDTNVIQQMWQLASNKLGNMSWEDGTPDNDKDDYYCQYGYDQVELFMWDKGTVILRPVDSTKQIESLTAANGGVTITKLANGAYALTGITKDVDLKIRFVGEPDEPLQPAVCDSSDSDDSKSDDSKKDNTNTNNASTPVLFAPVIAPPVTATPAVATVTLGTPVPTAPSATVLALAPVINPSALYAAVDLNGVPTDAKVTSTNNSAMSDASSDLIKQALTASGINHEEYHAGFTGTITTASQGSVMTLNNVVSSLNYKYGTDIFVTFKNPVTGEMTYVVPKINKDGSISFEVPFGNCEFSVVYAEKVSVEEQLKREEAEKKNQ